MALNPNDPTVQQFLRNLQNLQHQFDNRPFDLNEPAGLQIGREPRVSPWRRYGDFEFSTSVKSKRGFQNLFDVFWLVSLAATAGFFISLGFLLYVKPIVFIVLTAIFARTCRGFGYVAPAILAIQSVIDITMTIIDHFGSENQESLAQDLKSILKVAENLLNSAYGHFIIAMAIFKLNISDPDSPVYCHPVLFAVVAIDVSRSLLWYGIPWICDVIFGNNNGGGMTWLGPFFLGLLKLVLRTMPLRPELVPGIVNALMAFKNQPEMNEMVRANIGINLDREADELINLITG